MVEGKQIAVVIPAYNEEKLLETTVVGIPSFVDRIYIVDDASRDATVGRAHTVAAADSHENKARYLEWHPQAAAYFEMSDFGLYVLQPSTARFVGGFGEMGWVDLSVH